MVDTPLDTGLGLSEFVISTLIGLGVGFFLIYYLRHIKRDTRSSTDSLLIFVPDLRNSTLYKQILIDKFDSSGIWLRTLYTRSDISINTCTVL